LTGEPFGSTSPSIVAARVHNADGSTIGARDELQIRAEGDVLRQSLWSKSEIITIRDACGYGSGSKRIGLTALKIAVRPPSRVPTSAR